MRRSAPILFSVVLLSITAQAGDKDKIHFTSGPASSYPGHQTLDKITIAAVPFTSDEQQSSAFGKANPYKYGILPVLVIIQNDTGKALKLDLKAEYIDPANRHSDSMPALDVQLWDGARKASWKTGSSPLPPLPPLPGRKPKHGPLDVPEIEGLEFSAHLIPEGDSVRGFFYFEAQRLPGARVYLTGIKDAASGKDYFYFEVPFE
jgi:hypothetical protein